MPEHRQVWGLVEPQQSEVLPRIIGTEKATLVARLKPKKLGSLSPNN